jgi:phage baseplate assembly protein W
MSDQWKDIALPFGPDLRTFCTPHNDADVLKTSVLVILLTRKGELFMEPEFGSAFPDAVHEQNDHVLVALLKSSAQEAIRRWDDRIRFLDFTAVRNVNDLYCTVNLQDARDPNNVQPLTINMTFGASSISLLGF